MSLAIHVRLFWKIERKFLRKSSLCCDYFDSFFDTRPNFRHFQNNILFQAKQGNAVRLPIINLHKSSTQKEKSESRIYQLANKYHHLSKLGNGIFVPEYHLSIPLLNKSSTFDAWSLNGIIIGVFYSISFVVNSKSWGKIGKETMYTVHLYSQTEIQRQKHCTFIISTKRLGRIIDAAHRDLLLQYELLPCNTVVAQCVINDAQWRTVRTVCHSFNKLNKKIFKTHILIMAQQSHNLEQQ